MKELLARWLLFTLAIIFASRIVSGIAVSGWPPALAAAAVLGIINTFFRPVLIFLTLPVTLVTFVLYMLCANALTIGLGGLLVPGFYVSGLGPAVMGSIIVSVVNCMFTPLLQGDGRQYLG